MRRAIIDGLSRRITLAGPVPAWACSGGRSRLRAQLLVGAAVVLVSVGVVACSGAPSGVASQTYVQLGGGHKTTLAAAERLWGSPIPLPDVISPIRYGHPVRQIRLRLGSVSMFGQETQLTFNRGEVVVRAGPADYQDAAQAFRTDLAGIKIGHAALGVVNNQPALVVQPRTDYMKSNPALVEFDLHNIDIEVMSTTLGTRVLLAVADSIKD